MSTFAEVLGRNSPRLDILSPRQSVETLQHTHRVQQTLRVEQRTSIIHSPRPSISITSPREAPPPANTQSLRRPSILLDIQGFIAAEAEKGGKSQNTSPTKSPNLSPTNGKAPTNGHVIPVIEHLNHRIEHQSIKVEKIEPQTPASKALVEEQVKWDKQASMTDEKQAQLFHTQWALLREQFSFFSTELKQIHGDIKTLKANQEKVFEDELKLNQHTDNIKELQEESRLRREGLERLRADVKETCTQLSDRINLEVKDRTAAFHDAMDLGHQAKQLIEQECLDRKASDEDIIRQLHNAVRSIDQEQLDREQGISALRAQLDSVQTEFGFEKTHRTEGIAVLQRELQRGIQSVELASMDNVKDLRISLEAEIAARGAADSRLEKGQGDLQYLIDMELEKRMRLQEDLEKSFSIFKAELQQEAQTRSAAADQLANGQQRMKDLLEDEIANRAQVVAEIGERFRALSDSQFSEAKDRSNGLQELKKDVVGLREALETESRQRAAANNQLSDLIRAESGHRADGDEKAKLGLNGLTGKLETELETVRDKISREARRASAMEEALARMEGHWHTTIEGEVNTLRDANARLGAEIREGVRHLSEALHQEMKERTTGTEDIARQVLSMRDGLDREIKDRAQGDEDHLARFGELVHALDQQKRERAASNDLWAKELEKNREDIANEKAARTDAASVLGVALQTLDANTTQQLKDLLAKLEAESRARNVSNSAFEQSFIELNQNVKEEVAARIKGDDELEKYARMLRQDLEAEVKLRSSGDKDAAKSLKELIHKVDQALDGFSEEMRKESIQRQAADRDLGQIEVRIASALDNEARHRKEGDEKNDIELREAVKNLSLALNAETKDRGLAVDQLIRETKEIMTTVEQETITRVAPLEDFAKHIQDLKAAFEREKADRDRGDTALEKGLADSKHDLANEKGERSRAVDAVQKELQVMMEQLNGHLHDIFMKLDQEASTREGAMKKHERDHGDLRASHDSEVDKRLKIYEDMDRNLRTLRQDLEEEGKLRVAVNDSVRDLINTEKSERIASDEASLHRLNNAFVKLDSGVEAFRDLMQGRFALLSGKLDKPTRSEPSPARVTTFYIGED